MMRMTAMVQSISMPFLIPTAFVIAAAPATADGLETRVGIPWFLARDFRR
jgi:hypothetical protein